MLSQHICKLANRVAYTPYWVQRHFDIGDTDIPFTLISDSFTDCWLVPQHDDQLLTEKILLG